MDRFLEAFRQGLREAGLYVRYQRFRWKPTSSLTTTRGTDGREEATHAEDPRIKELVRERGFALVIGDPSTGKSVALRILAHNLEPQPDVLAAMLTRSQSNLGEEPLASQVLDAEEGGRGSFWCRSDQT